MTLSIRAPAQLFTPDGSMALAEGIAVIWADPAGWGGVFEVAGAAVALHAAVRAAPFAANLHLADGRTAAVTLGLSAFVADGQQPIIFQGHGPIDSAGFRYFTDEAGRRP